MSSEKEAGQAEEEDYGVTVLGGGAAAGSSDDAREPRGNLHLPAGVQVHRRHTGLHRGNREQSPGNILHYRPVCPSSLPKFQEVSSGAKTFAYLRLFIII